MIGKNQFFWVVIISLIFLFALFLLDLSFGASKISFSNVISTVFGGETNSVLHSIIIDIRLSKTVTGLLAGAGLSLCGLLSQTLFRNPLAGPDVLGLSAGASLAVALVILTGFTGIWTVATAASLGAGFVFLIIIGVSRKISSNASLLIVGLMVAALASSVIGILQYLSSAEDLQMYTLWTMGNISSASWDEILIILLTIIIGVSFSLIEAKSLNAWVLGERYNQAMGLSTSAIRWKILLISCLIAGSITAFCGPVTFVGIAVPHFVKRIFPTHNHQKLIPLSIIWGGALLLICDLLTQLPGDGTILPINAATALFGAPVIIWIVVQSKKEFY